MTHETYRIGQIKACENVDFGDALKAVIQAKYVQVGGYGDAGPVYRLRTKLDDEMAAMAKVEREAKAAYDKAHPLTDSQRGG